MKLLHNNAKHPLENVHRRPLPALASFPVLPSPSPWTLPPVPSFGPRMFVSCCPRSTLITHTLRIQLQEGPRYRSLAHCWARSRNPGWDASGHLCRRGRLAHGRKGWAGDMSLCWGECVSDAFGCNSL